MLSQEKPTRLHSRPVEAFKTQREPLQQKRARRFPSFQVIRKISKAKFSVYLIFCETLNQHFAMKVFPYKDDKVSSNFSSEIRFARLDHPNIVKIVHYELVRETVSHDNLMMVSYLVMDYAPYGDFYDIVAVKKLLTDDKLVRTYFRQLIEGLEYLHSRKIGHLDLKLENLLMGKGFMLKIADFDLAYVKGDARISTKGTKFYRAPELLEQKCRDVEAADMYAAGVVLFVFKTGGILPHSETQLYKGMNLFEMLKENNKEFWVKHCDIQGKSSSFFDLDFRNLFNMLTKVDPRERATLVDVKKSKWYNGPVYSQEEIVAIMSEYF